ncbi:MAG: TOBE domain-containing protein [Ottowia sp.]|nr:TOBE domain-containing protein [Ottowia sp.]
MPTAPRSALPCTVAAIRAGHIHDEIELRSAGASTLIATVTHYSTKALGLCPGARVEALVKPASVLLVAGSESVRIAAQNTLHATIEAIEPGAVRHEITLSLPGGESLAASLTRPCAERLGLTPGQPVRAVFKASAVILARAE